ncbi:MAG: hypothetical protein QNJ63_17640 [Calothrix sp. MO_192.B10]|nr:hypothetical protein [Calothrix sp. MO_192.B10]
MLHRISIPVEHPLHVANVLAEILHGSILRGSEYPYSYTVLVNDEYGSAIVLSPAGNEVIVGQSRDKFEYQYNPNYSEFSPVHLAISVPLTQPEIEKIAQREGWHMAVGNRGRFKLIEFWLENKFLLELILPATVPQYVKSMTPQEFMVLALIMGGLRKIQAIASSFSSIKFGF